MPKSLVTITDTKTCTKIEIPEEYHVYIPKEGLLVIQKLFSYQFAVIDYRELRVLQNTLQRKSIVPSILLALSWTPERTTSDTKKSKRSKKNNEVKEPPKITMLKFIRKTVVVQNPQTQQQAQTQQQSQNQQQSK